MIGTFFRYFIKKTIEIIASLAVLAALSFLLLKALPGGPFDEETALNPTVKAELSRHWQLESNSFAQVTSYLSSLAQGDLGVSMVRPDRRVLDIIGQGLSNSLLLNSLSFVVILIGAFVISLLALRFQNSRFEEALDQFVIICLSLPSLFWGPLLIYLFAFYWNVLPVALLDTPAHYILPVLTLSLRPMASLIRLLKNSMAENMSADYIRTAKAKGLEPWHVLRIHLLKNSLIPFLSFLGPLTASLISGSFLVELLFAVPGLGTEFINSLNDRDYTLIVGLTLFYGVLLILLNSLFDVLMKLADPRLREEM